VTTKEEKTPSCHAFLSLARLLAAQPPSNSLSAVLAAPTTGRRSHPTLPSPAARLAATRLTPGPCTPLPPWRGGGAPPSHPFSAATTTPSLAFDATGELLALAHPGAGGGVDVYMEGDLRRGWEGTLDALTPVLRLDPAGFCARALAWDGAPGRGDWLGVLECGAPSSASRLALYDLRTCGTGAPTRALTPGPGSGVGAGGGEGGAAAARPLTTLASLGSPAWPASAWAAGDGTGTVRVWDARAPGDRPAAWLVCGGRAGGAVTALCALGAGGGAPSPGAGPPLILGAAGLDGLLNLWDTRGGSGASSTSLGTGGLGLGGVPPLASFPASAALARVPGLAAQAGPAPGACPVVSLHASPTCSATAALHLDCGWSAVLEVGRGGGEGGNGTAPPPATITHLHAPAWGPGDAGGTHLPALSGVGRRAPAWSPITGTFIVPRVRGGLMMEDGARTEHALLDFSPGRGSPLAVVGCGDEDSSPPPALPTSVSLVLPGRVSSLAVHPRSGELVGAGRSAGGGWVGLQFYAGCV
jgi:hypothetical protein